MKNIHLILLILPCFESKAQKPPLTDTTYKLWTSVDQGALSNDGQYACYQIQNEPLGKNTLVVMTTENKWEMRLISCANVSFSKDNKYLIAIKGKDSLIQLDLKTKQLVRGIPNIKSYQLLSKGKEEWLIYQLNDVQRYMVVENLQSGKISKFMNVKELILNKATSGLVLKTQARKEDSEVLEWVDLEKGVAKEIYQGQTTTSHIFDRTGIKMAFTTIESGKKIIWYFEHTAPSAIPLADDHSAGISAGLKISTEKFWRFSSNGENLFFTLSKNYDDPNVNPLIWSYEDAHLQSEILKMGPAAIHEAENFTKLHLADKKITQLLNGYQKISEYSDTQKKDSILIVENTFGNNAESDWNKCLESGYSICFTETGEIEPVISISGSKNVEEVLLSPDNNYLVYYDRVLNAFKSYDIAARTTYVISKGLDKELMLYDAETRLNIALPKILGWYNGENKLLVQGTYDIWALDAQVPTTPRNFTDDIGTRNKICLSIEANRMYHIINGEGLIISGFNLRTKQCYIYIYDSKSRHLNFLYRTSDFIGGNSGLYSAMAFNVLIRSKSADRYLLKLGNVMQTPNYFFTSNFKQFKPVSAVYPEKEYNWLKSELAIYKDAKGNLCEGILYKPDNFDSTKKYPVIFEYYLEQSNSLNKHLSPELEMSGINIPYLVSNGYLVFKPNIYKIFKRMPGESALIALNAAADYLSKFKWVDSAKFGITGHSYGGYETNYLITRTNRFAAAVSGAGMANFISFYNLIWPRTQTSFQNYVKTALGMEQNLDSIPSDYMNASPIFFTKNVKTPLLLIHNKDDENVPVTQSLEFFVSLRSLQKPVWLLQYRGETHALTTEENQLDGERKVKGFFDYYLKAYAKPNWMVKHF